MLDMAIKAERTKKGTLRDFLLEGAEPKQEKHAPERGGCEYAEHDNDRVTEKRLCRCMYYHNRRAEDGGRDRSCAQCKFPEKWENKSDYVILDYEVPMEQVWEKVGGIDLLIRGKNGGPVYAVEVKPENSTETVARMIAEILTYAEISEYRVCGYDISPAICFFKDSAQWRDYRWLKTRSEFQTLTEKVQVFYITHDKTSFEIRRMDEDR